MERTYIDFLIMLLALIVFYKATDYLHKKALKKPLETDDKEQLAFEKYSNHKLKLGKNIFLIMIFFYLLLTIYKFVSSL